MASRASVRLGIRPPGKPWSRMEDSVSYWPTWPMIGKAYRETPVFRDAIEYR
jgi:hypothetical protein